MTTEEPSGKAIIVTPGDNGKLYFQLVNQQWATSYELDYAVISSGGGDASSSSYNMDSIVSTTGVGAEAQSSSSYSVDSPLVDIEPPAAVEDWMLHWGNFEFHFIVTEQQIQFRGTKSWNLSKQH